MKNNINLDQLKSALKQAVELGKRISAGSTNEEFSNESNTITNLLINGKKMEVNTKKNLLITSKSKPNEYRSSIVFTNSKDKKLFENLVKQDINEAIKLCNEVFGFKNVDGENGATQILLTNSNEGYAITTEAMPEILTTVVDYEAVMPLLRPTVMQDYIGEKQPIGKLGQIKIQWPQVQFHGGQTTIDWQPGMTTVPSTSNINWRWATIRRFANSYQTNMLTDANYGLAGQSAESLAIQGMQIERKNFIDTLLAFGYQNIKGAFNAKKLPAIVSMKRSAKNPASSNPMYYSIDEWVEFFQDVKTKLNKQYGRHIKGFVTEIDWLVGIELDAYLTATGNSQFYTTTPWDWAMEKVFKGIKVNYITTPIVDEGMTPDEYGKAGLMQFKCKDPMPKEQMKEYCVTALQMLKAYDDGQVHNQALFWDTTGVVIQKAYGIVTYQYGTGIGLDLSKKPVK